MAMRRFEGVDSKSEISALKIREDMRSIPEKLRDFWLEPHGQQATYIAFFVATVLLLWVPLGGEFILLLMALFGAVKLRYKKLKWDFPFRVPMAAQLMDGSIAGKKMGQGLFYLGSETQSKMPAYISDNDARTHGLFFGTTGSGKTEFLLAFVVNSLFYGGGSSYTDGKGDVKLWLKFLNACRLVGREQDLLLISFITSGKEFYDRQHTLASNTINPYSNGSSGMCTEASIALMDSGGGDDMWKGRAIAFLGGLIKPLVFLRDQGEILLSADLIRSYFDLPMLERFVYDEEDTWKGGVKRPKGYFRKTYGKVWDVVIRPLKAFMVTIPGYDFSKLGKQEQKTLEQHGYITMQLARLYGDMADNYGHIMDTPLGHVDMYDVVINNRILVTLLPALERSPESLGMLGKIIVGGIKQMAAGCLGNRVEGLRREIVDARPTNSPVPFVTIFDEYGYYAVLGFSSMPAQARSLGFMVIFAAQDFASLKKSSPEEADQTWENTNIRGIGRITSGAAAETYKRMEELGGTVQVAELSGYARVFGSLRTRIRAEEGIKIERKPRVSSDDLHSQADGEFHLFLGKKAQDASKGAVYVSRVNGFYTDLTVGDKRDQPQVEILALNHFGRVTPPAVIAVEDDDPGLVGPRGLLSLMRSEDALGKLVKARESVSARYSELIQVECVDAAIGAQRMGSLEAMMMGMLLQVEGNTQRKNIRAAITEVSSQLAAIKEEDASGDGGEAGSGGLAAAPGKPRVAAANIALYSKMSSGPVQSVVVPVTPNSPEEIKELAQGAQEIGFKMAEGETADAVRASIQTGSLKMDAAPLKSAEGMAQAMLDASGGPVSDAERQRAQEHSQSLKVSLDQSTTYIEEPTPDLDSALVADADVVANELYMALTDPEASWAVK